MRAKEELVGFDIIFERHKTGVDARLSVVTVVKDDLPGLLETARSIQLIAPRDSVEYVIWINADSTNIAESLGLFSMYANKVIVGNDSGIFDAMNKALEFCSGHYVLFLNARDTVIESFRVDTLEKPSLVRVKYNDYFGFDREVRVNTRLDRGIPFCHQGMILPRYGYLYDVSYKYGSDYLALLNFNLKWPLPMLETGLICYDTTGVSTINRWSSDKWTARVIRERFDALAALRYLVVCLIKLAIKRVYDLYVFMRCKKKGKNVDTTS